MADVGLGFGANLGDRLGALIAALKALGATDGVKLTAVSRVFATKPWGAPDQPDFLNLCALAETSLTPQALLAACQVIERLLHRTTTYRWGPRTIDIDILFIDELNLTTEHLTLPHPRIAERLFVLVPLADLRRTAPGLAQPIQDVIGALQRSQPTPDVLVDESATFVLRREIRC